MRGNDVDLAGANLVNALERVVFVKYPLLKMLAEGLRDAGAPGALLSGSGATVFALARDESHAHAVRKAVADAMGPWLWSKVVRTLPDGVMVAHGPLEA